MGSVSARRLLFLFVTTLCLACGARAQGGGASVKVSGVVSATVALSFDQGERTSAGGARVASSHVEGGALVINISGTARALTHVSVPIRIRSNTGYRLLAAAKSDGAE